MEKPLVSVIVPIYNSEKFLDECIQSVLNQTLKEIELILVDDASPDNSFEIMQKYALCDERVVIVRNAINGHPNARNAGILVAKADYLGFVDADDWVAPDMFEKLYSATNGGKHDIVIGEYEWVYADGRIVRDSNVDDRYITGDVRDVVIADSTNGGRLFTNIWRKNLILEDNLLFLDDNHYCDFIVSAWYMKANSVAKVSEPFYKYRINSISITAKKDNIRFFNRLYSAKYTLEKIKDIGLYDIYKEEADFLFYRLYYLNTIIGCVKNFTKLPYDVIDDVKKEFKNTIDVRRNKYYQQVKWKKWNLLARIINFNTRIGCIIARVAIFLYK